MTEEITTEERIEIVLMYGKYENSTEVYRQLKKRSSSQPPSTRAIQKLVKKFKETGSVHDRDKSGRPRSVVTEDTIEKVKEFLENTPQTSSRKGAIELGISHTSFHRAIKESDYRPYRPTTTIELSDDDFDRRIEYCETFLAKLKEESRLLDKIVWSDESQFMLNGTINRHNCCYYATSNPHIEIPVANSKLSVMVWCGITSSEIIGPYFFEENVTGESYLAMLQNFLWDKIKGKRMLFQQDGASPHYAVSVRNWLDEKFAGRWLGRRGPIEWPARSPDLTPCDFFLWGYLKDIVYRDRPATIEQLRERITQACAEIPADMCAKACENVAERYRRCIDAGGKQQF
jgi:hypothetical protein